MVAEKFSHRRMRCAGLCITHWGQERNAYKILVGKPEGRTIILKWILEKQDRMIWNGYIWLIPLAGSCEHGNVHSGSIESRKILE
jgi:hypothetical protein